MIVLDIGPGIRPQQTFTDCVHVCVEPHHEYVNVLMEEHPDYVVLQAEWKDVPKLFPPKSVDYITLYDVIEHVEKQQALRLLEATLPIARVGVSVYTTWGFVSQLPGEEDAWGLHGGKWQQHRSGWIPDDFPGWYIRTDTEMGDGVPRIMAYHASE